MATSFPRGTHDHVQNEASDTWTIAHGLNCRPGVSVSIDYEGSLQVILPYSIKHVNLNTVEVKFSAPQSGVAHLA